MDKNTNEISGIHKELLSQIKKGECILFLGAGVHAPPPENSNYNYPDINRPKLGGELVKELAEECGYSKKFPEESPLDLQRVSLCYEMSEHLGRRKLVNSLDNHLRVDKIPSPVLEMLSELPFSITVTTNYDKLLETAMRRHGKDPAIFCYNSKPRPDEPTPDMSEDPTAERPMIFKMHGDLEKRESIVITDEDYITFVQRMSDKDRYHPVPQTIRYRMLRWTTLFVGYSLRDYNLRLLFRTLRWKVDQANIPNSFSIDRSPDPLILQVWQHERRFITFVTEDLWKFVPWLYKEVKGREFGS